MPKKPDHELTADEARLLIIAAKLFDIAKEYAVRPPHSDYEIAYWNGKVKEELVRSPSFHADI